MREKVTDGVPGKFQLIWEIIYVDMVGDLAESAVGPKGKKFVPLGVTVFIFILVVQLDRLPAHGHAPRRVGRDPPGADERREPAPRDGALRHRVGAHRVASRARSFGGYFKHYTKPYAGC